MVRPSKLTEAIGFDRTLCVQIKKTIMNTLKTLVTEQNYFVMYLKPMLKVLPNPEFTPFQKLVYKSSMFNPRLN